MLRNFFLFGLFILLIWVVKEPVFPSYHNYVNKLITKIEFAGNHYVSDSELYNLISSKVNTKLVISKLNDDLKVLFQKGTFKDIKVWAEDYKKGVFLRFNLKERAFVKEIVFKGMKEFTEIDIQKEIPIQRDEAYSENKIKATIRYIELKYHKEGFLLASIRSKNEIIPETEGGLKIVFLVDEGEELKVQSIIIKGSEQLTSKQIKGGLELDETGFFKDGIFTKQKFEADKINVITYLKEEGFLDSTLVDASWKPVWIDKAKETRGIKITFTVQEGQRYFFNGYAITWNKTYLNPETKEPLFTKKKLATYMEYTNRNIGDVYDGTRIERDRGSINYLYSQAGYIFARVVPIHKRIVLSEKSLKELESTPEQIESVKNNQDYYNIAKLRIILLKNKKKHNKLFVHTTLHIAEGEKGYIENIIIKGNKKTKEKVIRRELLIKPGELFNADLVKRTQEILSNLGYFKSVNIDARPGSSEGSLNLLVKIVEQPTGNINLGGGYGTVNGFSIFAELSERNFQGGGQRISGKIDFGPRRSLVSSSWLEPWLLGYPLSLNLTLAYNNNEIPNSSIAGGSTSASYRESLFSFAVGIGRRFAIYWGHTHTLQPAFSQVSNPSSLVQDNIYTRVAQGWQFQNSFINRFYFDNRDNVFNTTKGLLADISVGFTGNFLGGTDHFIKYQPKLVFYWWPFDYTLFGLLRKNVLRRWRVVIEHRLSMGFTQTLGPVYNQQKRIDNPYVEVGNYYLLGRYESLRGWNVYDDSDYPLAWRDGGSHRVSFGTELRIPIEPSILWFVFFFDGGALFEDVNNILLDTSTTNSALISSIQSSALTPSNISLGYFKYSWGFGLRIQIPVLPLRFFFARKVIWDTSSNKFVELRKNFEFEFAIGDFRF